ncbi:MAG: ribbon-helix-helix protein, CopG family [Gallionella sp.]|jgi:predicted transcriptional regulator|nr:ribbon-helix-helix protein, CopG family [Gallionella sp.]
MTTANLAIRPDLKDQLDHLAEASQRSESELVNEALTLYLLQQHRIRAKIQTGLVQAQIGDFVTDEEMEEFFAGYSQQQA